MNQTLPKQIIKPNTRFDRGIVHCFIEAVKNQVNRKDMVYQLFRKEFLGGYRKSFLGSTWIIITPFAGMVSWVLLHYAQVIQPGNIGVPYPAYVLIGTLVWGLFIRISNTFMSALQRYRSILLSVNFPHEVIFGTTLLLISVDFLISFTITILLLTLFGIELTWSILFFPLVVLPLLLFAMAIGLFVSTLSVVSYDIRQIVASLLRLIMFVIPIIYSSDAVKNSFLKIIIHFNPLTYLVCSARDIVLFGRLYSVQGYLLSSALSCIVIIFAWRIFYVSEDIILERMI